MAFTRGQVDRFGRPIPASPGYQVLINADGSEVQQRNRLILPAGLVASDSDDSDASSLSLEAITPGDLAPIAAHTVIGNNSASTAVPSAEPATAIGFGVLAAATQAALTALIALATSSLAGLMSAAQFLKLDATYDVIHSAAYSAVTSVASTTWTAGTYRRIEVVLKNRAGASTFVTIACAGLDAASYYVSGTVIATTTDKSFAAQDFFKMDASLAGMAGGSLKADIQVATDGGYRTITGLMSMASGQGMAFSGLSLDVTHNVTGITVGFSTASSGWLEVIGYK